MATISSQTRLARWMKLPLLGNWSLGGVAFVYLTLILIIPLGALVHDGLQGGLGVLWQSLTQSIVWHALLLTLWTAALAAGINAIMGLLTAYVLVRYEFPGKAILNAIVDLPLAIPTLITGVMFLVLLGPQEPLGKWLGNVLHVQILFAPSAIVLVLLFVTFPFVVRAVQPVLEALDRDPEAAAATLGAGDWTIFRRVTLPALSLPLISGTLLSFARSIGEFGAVVLVSGNIPFHTQTAAVYVLGEIESSDQLGASAISLVLLAVAFALTLVVDALQQRLQRQGGAA
ncbi:MAG TPA: sulfate ABC transporter permease subunit CysT [Ktedonobacterales bacterium]|nr:sulfate ABC transporter permease subunit CysT [Ktedonobacterales bacterium]